MMNDEGMRASLFCGYLWGEIWTLNPWWVWVEMGEVGLGVDSVDGDKM